MQRAAAREEKIEKVEEEVQPDVSFGSTSTVSRRWYFSLSNLNNLHCFFYPTVVKLRCYLVKIGFVPK